VRTLTSAGLGRPPPTTLATAYAFDTPAPDTLTRRRERIAGIHGLSIDTIELYEPNMIDELAPGSCTGSYR
jgi:hypothetical protein